MLLRSHERLFRAVIGSYPLLDMLRYDHFLIST
jgi:prolyl oligopeptidase PreP (S9A serine peptidase family)